MQKNIPILSALLLLFVNVYGQDKRIPIHSLNDTTYIQELIKKADAIPGSLADSAMQLYIQAALYSEKAHYAKGSVYAWLKVAEYSYNIKNDYSKGLSATNSAIRHLDQLTEEADNHLIPTAFNIKGINLYRMAEYDSAIYYYQLALAAMDSLSVQRPKLKSQILHNIGSAFITLHQLATGISYYHKALEVPGIDSLQLAVGYTDMGSTYANLVGDMDSATYWWSKATAIYRKQKRYRDLQYLYANMSIGWQAPEHEDLIKADRYLDSAISANPADAYKHYLVLRAAAMQAYKQGNYRQAIDYCNRLITISQSTGSTLTLSQAYWLLSYSYAFLGDKAHTNEYQLKYAQLNDSINYEDSRHAINALEIKYKISEKEKALARSKARAYRQRNWLILAIGGLLLAGLLFLTYFRNARQRRRLDAEKITSLEQQQQIQALHIRMEAEENERIRISGELHDGLGVLISAAKLNNTLLKKNIGTDTQRMQDICTDGASILDHIHQEMRSIAHNLNPEYYLSHKGLREALAHLASKLQSDAFHIRISEFGTPQQIHPQRSFVIYRIMEEVINNSLRHSGGSLLDIQLVYTDTDLNISAEDNGTGFDIASAVRGIGLSNIERRVEQLNGHLILNSEKGSGSAYMITIPY